MARRKQKEQNRVLCDEGDVQGKGHGQEECSIRDERTETPVWSQELV